MQEENLIWPPAPTVAPPELKTRSPSKLRPFLFPVALSLMMGMVDACHPGHGPNAFIWLRYAFAGVVLGFVAPTHARFWGLLLAISLYVVHVVAILCGVKQPFVESDPVDALGCFNVLVPAYAGVYAGVGIKKLMDKRRAR